jgi:methylenetetrahydrofolate reductase (NADPH)
MQNPCSAPLRALALSALIQKRSGKPAALHCTTRDHNRLSIQGLLWGARALGISSVLVSTGDYVALGEEGWTTRVQDIDVYALVRMARAAELVTGVVLDPRPESNRLAYEVRRLEQKIEAGAQFVVTQPVYDSTAASELHDATSHLELPVSLGVLPLLSERHARFLHNRVAGIAVPKDVRARLEQASDPALEGVIGARHMVDVARQWFAGACIMPPFDRYDLLADILSPEEGGEAGSRIVPGTCWTT